MQQAPDPQNGDNQKEQPGSASAPDLHAEQDGRNKEWEDRGRVNLDTVPPGVQTNVERDYEAEQPPPARDEPAY